MFQDLTYLTLSDKWFTLEAERAPYQDREDSGTNRILFTSGEKILLSISSLSLGLYGEI